MPEKDSCRPKSFVWGLLAVSIILNIILLCRIERTAEKPEKSVPPAPAIPAVPAPAASAAPCMKPAPAKVLKLTGSSYQSWNDRICLQFADASEIVAESVKLSIEPEVKDLSGRVVMDDLDLEGEFVPETVYTVTIQPGMRDTSGRVLEKTAAAVIRTPKRTPAISFVTSGPYMPLQGGRRVALRFCNVEKVRYRLHRFYENNFNVTDFDRYDASRFAKVAAEWEETLDFPRNQVCLKNLELDGMLPERTPGVYLLEAVCTDKNSWTSDRLPIVLTDLAVMAVGDENARQVAVAVRRLSDRKPVAGASVTLTSARNQFAGSGTTGPDGTAVIAFAGKFDNADDPVKSLTVRAGKDVTFFKLEDANSTGAIPVGKAEAFLPGKAPCAFVYTPRGIYRPGEKIDVSLFMRRPEAGKMVVQANTPCTLELRDPRDRVTAQIPVKTDADGFASAVFQLEKTAASGNYRIRCVLKDAVWGETSVLAGAFVPDRIRVKVKPLDADLAGPGENLHFRIDANYYFGPEVTAGTWRGRFKSSPAAPPAHWRGWTVGCEEGFRPLDKKLKAEKIDGAMIFTYSGQQQKAFVPVKLIAAGSVAEPGGRMVTGIASQTLLPTPDFIALRQRDSRTPVAEFDYSLVNFDPARPVPEKRGTWRITLEKKEWDYAFNAQSGRREWFEKTTPLPELSRSLASGPATGSFQLKDLRSGNYVLTVADETGLRKTALEFWHAAGEGTARSASPLALDITLDKPLYRAGETAELRFNVPFAGTVCAAFGERGIDRISQIPAAAGSNTLKVVIPADVSGDAYFAGVTFAGTSGDRLLRTFGALRIPVDRSDRRLAVELIAPRVAHSGEKAAAKIRLRNAAGQPCAGRVQLMACDPGVLVLTQYRTPDIFGFFWKNRRSGMAFYDMYARLFPDLKITPDGQIAGDGAGLGDATDQDRFSHFKTAAFVLPPVAVPASGEAEIPFSVPEHQGALMLMAVASSPDAAGSGEAEMIVREAASCLAHLPRAAAPGDEFDAVFTVFNHDLAESDFTLDLHLPKSLKSAAGTHFAGRLAPGKQAVFTVRLTAAEAGLSTVRSELAIGKFRKTWSASTVVRAVRLPEVETVVRAVAPGASDTWGPDAAAWQGKPEVRGMLFASPTAGIDQALDFLNRYPYGCLEQTVSTAFPLLAAPELVKAGFLPAAAADTVAPRAVDAYVRILPMMLSDGSFAMWPGGLKPWPEATVFAAHYLAAAEQAGVLKPDPTVMDKVKMNLVHYAADSNLDRNLRAYACYVLAFAGSDRGLVETKRLLVEKRGDLAAFLAGAALVRSGYGAEGRAAMREALGAKCYREALFAGFGEKNTAAGMMLAILMSVDPDARFAAELAMHLQKSLRPDGSAWGVTQNNAWAVVGLAKFAAAFPASPVAVGSEDGKKLQAGKFTPAALPVKLTNEGKGTVFVRYTVRGMSARPAASGGAITLKRTILDEQGNPVEKVRHGELVKIRLDIAAPGPVRNLVVCDLLPGGLEIEDPRLATRSATPEAKEGDLSLRRLERLDDRLLLFADLEGKTASFTYTARAVTRGKFRRAPLRAEAMYDADMQGVYADPAVLAVE